MIANVWIKTFYHIIWCNKYSYVSYGTFLFQKQRDLGPALWDYGYIEYLRHSIPDDAEDSVRESALGSIKFQESMRDYYTASLRQVNHLIQIGETNLELSESKWELYKVSISFQQISKFNNFIDLNIYLLP